jgi:hypothetical protein
LRDAFGAAASRSARELSLVRRSRYHSLPNTVSYPLGNKVELLVLVPILVLMLVLIWLSRVQFLVGVAGEPGPGIVLLEDGDGAWDVGRGVGRGVVIVVEGWDQSSACF